MRDEYRETEKADGEWGYRELEEVEQERRRVNGEYEQEVRGYGE